MAKRLQQRVTSDKQEEKKNMVAVDKIQIGQFVKLSDLIFQVTQIDVLKDRICLVDKYADDHYISKSQSVEVVDNPIKESSESDI